MHAVDTHRICQIGTKSQFETLIALATEAGYRDLRVAVGNALNVSPSKAAKMALDGKIEDVDALIDSFREIVAAGSTGAAVGDAVPPAEKAPIEPPILADIRTGNVRKAVSAIAEIEDVAILDAIVAGGEDRKTVLAAVEIRRAVLAPDPDAPKDNVLDPVDVRSDDVDAGDAVDRDVATESESDPVPAPIDEEDPSAYVATDEEDELVASEANAPAPVAPVLTYRGAQLLADFARLLGRTEEEVLGALAEIRAGRPAREPRAPRAPRPVAEAGDSARVPNKVAIEAVLAGKDGVDEIVLSADEMTAAGFPATWVSGFSAWAPTRAAARAFRAFGFDSRRRGRDAVVLTRVRE